MPRLGPYAGHTTLPGLKISPHGSVLTKVNVYTASLTPGTIAPSTSAEKSLSVTGLLADDIVVSVNAPAAHAAGTGIVGWRIATANTLLVTFANSSAATATLTTGTYTIVTLNYE